MTADENHTSQTSTAPPVPPAAPRGPWRRRLRIGALACLGALLLGFVALYLFRDRIVLSLLGRGVDIGLDLELNTGRLETKLFPGRARATGVRIENPPGFENIAAPVLFAESARIKTGVMLLSPLFDRIRRGTKYVHIPEIEADGAALNIVRNEKGLVNLDHPIRHMLMRRKQRRGPRLEYAYDRISLNACTIRWADLTRRPPDPNRPGRAPPLIELVDVRIDLENITNIGQGDKALGRGKLTGTVRADGEARGRVAAEAVFALTGDEPEVRFSSIRFEQVDAMVFQAYFPAAVHPVLRRATIDIEAAGTWKARQADLSGTLRIRHPFPGLPRPIVTPIRLHGPPRDLKLSLLDRGLSLQKLIEAVREFNRGKRRVEDALMQYSKGNVIGPMIEAGRGLIEIALAGRKGWRAVTARVRDIRLLTYNVSDADEHAAARAPALMKMIRKSRADVIALQEVAPWLLEKIANDRGLKKSYEITPVGEEPAAPGGLVLLSRFPLVSSTWQPLDGADGARAAVLRVQLKIDDDRSLTVAVVRLREGAGASAARVRQLRQVFASLRDQPHVVVLGDFQFGDGDEQEAEGLDSDYVDVWRALNLFRPGFTWDVDANPLLKARAASAGESRRTDRVLVRSDAWAPEDARILGNKAVGWITGRNIYPSDHFAVRAVLRAKDAPAARADPHEPPAVPAD